ncbi:MAG: alpha/beta hydrolase [Bacteroidales bacterium]|nr:alpha/beta hydrolase [Bacteroidales bacterium]
MRQYFWGLLLVSTFILIHSCDFRKKQEQERPEKTSKEITPERITFKSNDNLLITAHLYENSKNNPVMILCHQAGYNKMEYAKIAQKLVKKGFTCLALDQRSGGSLKGHINETHARAQRKNYKTSYLDAEKDIKAAVQYISSHYDTPIILVGSSYSASLALKIAAEMEEVKAVAAFSPGEYFGDWLKLEPVIAELKKPVFVTSSQKEADDVYKLINNVGSKIKQQYIPTDFEGVHGAKALWPDYEYSDRYWKAFNDYLKAIKDQLG